MRIFVKQVNANEIHQIRSEAEEMEGFQRIDGFDPTEHRLVVSSGKVALEGQPIGSEADSKLSLVSRIEILEQKINDIKAEGI